MSENAPASSEAPAAYLIFDTESIPDGRLLGYVKYPAEGLTEEEAVARAQEEAREASYSGSDFLPVTFQIPVATCVLRVGTDLGLQSVSCLDAPEFRPRKIVESFWKGVNHYCVPKRGRVRLVTFNGRGFDLPLLEMAAFRYGLSSPDHFASSRKRYDGWHLDLMDWLTNFNAFRMVGGLNLLSKLLGKPGKMDVKGDMVYQLHQVGKVKEINDYCLYDTLDTYFVFVRTRVLTGEITLEQEQAVVRRAHRWLEEKGKEISGLKGYLENWGNWEPWP